MEIVFVRVFRVPCRRAGFDLLLEKMNGSLGIMRGPEQHPQRFADYFVICGLDKDSGLEPDKYFGESSSIFSRVYTRDEFSLAKREPRPRGFTLPSSIYVMSVVQFFFSQADRESVVLLGGFEIAILGN